MSDDAVEIFDYITIDSRLDPWKKRNKTHQYKTPGQVS